jgi:hypothetical protein
VEGVFELRGITSQSAQFLNVLAALPETTVVLIADLVETRPLPENPFDLLRARLLTAHQLTDIQQVEKLLALPLLGKQKPCELLVEMMRICPRGEENSTFFNCHFLQKLPRELRVLLSEADMSDKRQLSARVDQIWAHHVQHHHDIVATVAVEQRRQKMPQLQRSTAPEGGAEEWAVAVAMAAAAAVPTSPLLAADKRLLGGLQWVPPSLSWQNRPPACAGIISCMMKRSTTAPNRPPVPGRETRLPRAARCRRRQASGTHQGRPHRQAFLSRYGRQLQYLASQVH